MPFPLAEEIFSVPTPFNTRSALEKMTASVLDEIDGIGPKRKRLLLAHFGSVRAIMDADMDALRRVPELGEWGAKKIYAHFH